MSFPLGISHQYQCSSQKSFELSHPEPFSVGSWSIV